MNILNPRGYTAWLLIPEGLTLGRKRFANPTRHPGGNASNVVVVFDDIGVVQKGILKLNYLHFAVPYKTSSDLLSEDVKAITDKE